MINNEFIQQDFRVNRPSKFGLPVTSEINLIKHQVMMPKEIVQGKRILDVGSFIGITGDWCLNNGAASYTGVEIHPEFYQISLDLMNKYHVGKAWTLINEGVDDYFLNSTDCYDLIFCGGVIFGHVNHAWFLKELAKRSDHIILESRHPKAMWGPYVDNIPDQLWKELEYNTAYQEWHNGTMSMVGGIEHSAKITAANSSIGAVKLLMELEGFSSNLDMYEELKTCLPDAYGMFKDAGRVGRYAVEFRRDPAAKKHVLVDAVTKDTDLWNQNLIDWKSI